MSGTEIFFVVILLLVGGYGAVCLYLLLNQQRLIYEPDSHITATPDQHGYEYEHVTLKTQDGLNLDGWYVPSKQNVGVILFFHGNTGNISHRFETIDIFHLMGYNVLIFDYRGYGQSEGRPSEQGTFLDAKAALAYLTEQRGILEKDVIIFGRSLGGAVATWLAAHSQAKALVVESSFSSIPELGKDHYPLLPIRMISSYQYDSKVHIQGVQTPVLIIHSPNDEVIPFSHGEKLFENAPGPKKMLKIRGRHNDGFIYSGVVYTEGLRRFLQEDC